MSRLRSTLISWYEGQRFGVAVAGAAFLLSLLVTVDGLLGFEPAFRILYVVPLWFATRLGGRTAGFLLVILGTWVGTTIDLRGNYAMTTVVSSGLLHFFALGVLMFAIAKIEESLWSARKQAMHDPLTGLLNRRALKMFGGEAFARTQIMHKPLTAVVIDCDDFKKLNDEMGHRAGDHALQILARALDAETRDTDVIARIGGDEFVLLLPGSDAEEARGVMARVSINFDQRILDAGYGTSLSVGLASMDEGDGGIEDLLSRADEQMYFDKAKKKKRAYLN